MRHIHFYSTPVDIKPVLRRFEANAPLQFAEHGKRSEPFRPVYRSCEEIPNVGIATHGTGLFSPNYVVAFRGTKYIVDTFENDEGEQRWFLCNGSNKNTVLMTVAGIWKTGTAAWRPEHAAHPETSAEAHDMVSERAATELSARSANSGWVQRHWRCCGPESA